MAKKKEYSYECFVIIDGAVPVPWKSLTEEEKAAVKKKMSENLSRNMSRLFSSPDYMDEYKNF